MLPILQIWMKNTCTVVVQEKFPGRSSFLPQKSWILSLGKIRRLCQGSCSISTKRCAYILVLTAVAPSRLKFMFVYASLRFYSCERCDSSYFASVRRLIFPPILHHFTKQTSRRPCGADVLRIDSILTSWSTSNLSGEFPCHDDLFC